jgi:hypothetical protein
MHSELSRAFQQLDSVLAGNQDLWSCQPFTNNDLPWSHTHRHLTDALLALGDEEMLQLHCSQQQRQRWFQHMEPDLCAALYAFAPAPAAKLGPLDLDSFDSLGMPGRKWQQIVAFAGALPQRNLPHVDWCAGKGHLSRVVQRNQRQPVHCLEWDAALVATGRVLAARQRRDIRYHQHDVTQLLPPDCADPARVHIGLHACGELHHHLLRHVASTRAQAVALSPCCYHKVSTAHYVPLSGAARDSQLLLNRAALHLALKNTVPARRGERELRERERCWRLAFDALQRDIRGCDDYLNVPSCKRELLRQDFPGFCQWAASSRQLTLPTGIDYDHFLQRGRERQRAITRLELLRQLFSRPLELWLVLDCALYLQEHGYRVAVTQFCDDSVSPRNLLLQGERR